MVDSVGNLERDGQRHGQVVMNEFCETAGEQNDHGGLVSYTCPGELYSIPRSIHLARLAAFYPKCRDCVHRQDAGDVLPRTEQQNQVVERRVALTSLLNDESVRGVYLNELDRNRGLLWGESLAACLWDQQPMIARRDSVDPSQILSEKSIAPPSQTYRGPVVVVGFDERPSSPEIVTGIVLGLRRMGCPVIDLGQTLLPALAFSIQSTNAMAGVFVTGAGCDPSWTGFDLLSRNARPFFREGLIQLEKGVNTGVGRQSRQIGSHTALQGQAAYESSLETHFHAIRPLRISCGSSTRLIPRTLDRLFAKLPCELAHVPLPTRRRNLFDVNDIDLHRVATSVVESRHHLGVIIDEDGRHASFVTDRGHLVTAREIARLLMEFSQRDNHEAKFVVASSWMPEVKPWLFGREATAIDGGETAESLVNLLIQQEAVLALSADGRIWFREPRLSCDAFLVFAHILQALSLSDLPFSEVVGRINGTIR